MNTLMNLRGLLFGEIQNRIRQSSPLCSLLPAAATVWEQIVLYSAHARATSLRLIGQCV